MTGFSTDPRGLSRLEKIEQALLSLFSANGFLTTSGSDASGDLIFQTGTPPVERARIKADGTGSGMLSSRKLASFTAGAGGIVNDPTGTTGVTVQMPTGVKHLLIFWKAKTDYASSVDTVSMYVNGVLNAGATNYASYESEVFNNAGVVSTFVDSNQSNNLRVGYCPNNSNSIKFGSGLIIMPFVNSVFPMKHFIALSMMTSGQTAQEAVPPVMKNWWLGGGIWGADPLTDLTLYANNGTTFIEGSAFDFYAYY